MLILLFRKHAIMELMNIKCKRPPKGFTAESTQKRVQWVENSSGIDLSSVLTTSTENLQGVIEQHVGFHTIPLAIASPLLIHGDYADGYFKLPVCTVEGTLVYSLTRGMMATEGCGGIIVRHLGQRISRAPVFNFNTIQEIRPFIKFIDKHYKEIKRAAEDTTRFGKLLSIGKTILNCMVVLEFVYNTDNAAGQNMITIATKAACIYIMQKYGPVQYYLESGLNCDKKLSRRTMAEGRGHAVQTEVVLTKSVYSRLLHIEKERAKEFFAMGAIVSQVTGTLGTQLHIANALTAIYLAMGQDVACVAENSLGNLEVIEGENDDLKILLTLPSLTIGTIGGGVNLPSQRRNLELIQCHEGKDSAKKLAEIIGGAVLCLELSLLSAIVSDTFAESHSTYGRKNGQ